MVDLKGICSLTDFQRNTRDHIARLKKTGQPEVLTVNGRAELVVQSAEAYQSLLDALDLADSVRILRERLAAANRGDQGVPAEQVLKSIRSKLGIEGRR